MPDYDFSRLSSRSFEHLVQALATQVLGPGIKVFGDGPDGGREVTFEGKVSYPSPVENWNGYGVVQAKYKQRTGNTQQDGNWAVEQLRDELSKYTNPDTNLKKPDYFIYATNVVLTPVRRTGSKERVVEVLENFKEELSLKGYAVWDYDQLRVYLDVHESVRHAYRAFITPGDVLAKLLAELEPRSTDIYDTLVEFLEKELLSDEYVNLEQAGHGIEEPIPLATVFVDLPTHDGSPAIGENTLDDADVDVYDINVSMRSDKGFIKDVLAESSERLDPVSLGASAISPSLGAGAQRESRGRFVLVGGPGQGKTTLTQFICQIFRAAIISQRESPPSSLQTRRALSTIAAHCESENINHAVAPRFPFKLVLNDFAKALSSSEASEVHSVFSYLARQIQKRTETDISAGDLRRFLSLYPGVIIFDGLDEVPASSNRVQVLDAIRDFWVDVDNSNADILSIATSRPQGYNEDFSPLYYRHRHLAELSEEIGWHYATRLVEMRYQTDEDRKKKVLGRLKRAFREESTARLMRSPLQVTIMAALVDRIGQPPQARWKLFDSYYDVIYLREVERNIPASILLRDYQPDIKAIHNQVGLLLQIDAERTGGTDAKLSRDRFVSLVESRLRAEGHTGESLHTLAQEIVDAASQRLVFLVELEAGQIGFEIRSLQEFMASESLLDGTDQTIRNRLEEIAPIPFWRNVFLFAAGKCFSERQDLRDAIHSICASLNEIDGDELAATALVGSDLAVALLDEGSSRRQPKYAKMLARVALRALGSPNSDLQVKLAAIYERQLKGTFQEEMKLRLAGGTIPSSLGAWNCLLRLVASDIPWAIQLAAESWPCDRQEQIQILQAVSEPTKNTWAFGKLLQLLPSASVTTLTRTFQWDLRRDWANDHTLEQEQEAAIAVLQSRRLHHPAINVLGTSLSYGSLVRLKGSEYTTIQQLRHIDSWHTSWEVYKIGSEFWAEPSKEKLASALRSLAEHPFVECDTQPLFGQLTLPWPFVACINFCDNSTDILELADKVALGQLGEVNDWIAAETRWSEKGITGDDLIALSDDRLPFDTRIGELGFPPTLSGLGPVLSFDQTEGKLEGVLEIFDQLPPSRSRSFVAEAINWLLFDFGVAVPSGKRSSLPTLGLQRLGSIYREIPQGFPIPLHAVVHLIGDSISDVAEFFAIINDKGFLLQPHPIEFDTTKESVRVLCRAYAGLDQEAVAAILPVLGILAQTGQLSGRYIDVVDPGTQEDPSGKLAAFLIMLSQETWHADNSEQMIGAARQIGDMSSDDFGRIVSTLETMRPSGDFADMFVVALRELLPLNDYPAHQRYSNLLQDVMSRRNSHFADLSNASRFALSEGIMELLQA